MPGKSLKAFLEDAGVDYLSLTHPSAYTAQQLAHHARIVGDRVAKTVIIELDGKMAMLVLPATWRIHWQRLGRILETDFIDLADEMEFKDRFPGCDVGAMPPFGNLFGMPVYCSEALIRQPDMAFAACSHEESIHMSTEDFLHLVNPVVIEQGFIKPGSRKPDWLRRKPGSPDPKPARKRLESWELTGY